jgi:hypothetical protein
MLSNNWKSLAQAATAASFTLTLNTVELTLHYSGSQTPATLHAEVSISGIAVVDVASDPVAIHAQFATATFQGDNTLTEIVNKSACPFLVDYVNANLLHPLKIPPLGVKSVMASPPVLVTQPPYLLGFSALGAVQPLVPNPATWPTGKLFAAVDAPLVREVATAELPQGPQSGFSYSILSGEFRATLGPVTEVDFTQSQNQIHLKINAVAEATLTANLSIPTPLGTVSLGSVTLGPRATVSLGATGPITTNGQVVSWIVKNLDIPSFNFSFGDIPGWAVDIINPLLVPASDALGALATTTINAVLNGYTVALFKIPTVTATIGNKTYTLSAKNAVFSSTTVAPAGTLIVLAGDAVINVN